MCGPDSQQARMVPTVRLCDVRDQLSIGLVRGLLLSRTLRDHSVSAQAAGAVSAETSQVRRGWHGDHCSGRV